MTDLQQDAPSAPPAGWYPDPVRPGATRYWSGTGWTDQVSAPVAEPALAPLGPPGLPVRCRSGRRGSAGDVRCGAAGRRPSVTPASRSGTRRARSRFSARARRRCPRRCASSSGAAARQSDPYDRNWIAGVAIALAVLSIPGLAARVLWDLPALTQSIFAGAPIGISLLALVRGARRGSGLVAVDHRGRALGRHARRGMGRRSRAHPDRPSTRSPDCCPRNACSTGPVPDVGLEPTRPFGQRILSPPRLPFRQSGARARGHGTVNDTLPAPGRKHDGAAAGLECCDISDARAS